MRTLELLAKLVDVASSSGGSNRNPHSTGHPACISAMPVGSSSAVPVIPHEPDLVASPSFVVNLNCSCDEVVGEAGPLGAVAFVTPGSPAMVSVFGEVGPPDWVEDALPRKSFLITLHDDDDDVEPATIADDSDDETPQTTPAVGEEHLVQVGQQFQDKEEVVFSVKTYNIRHDVEYKVLESDHCKYYGKCKEFRGGCAWLIWVSLRQRKGIWEVKCYNGPHTCLATSISSNHRKLDYHVISAFILPMIKADAAMSIKILQNATEAHFDF
ncbi:uncharacterized protein LOC107620842 [Arachis ipaensis]|uniref:uncharacterized protein LOC107620842 n=1 Tax=Arachis ipaensis TaxID=130454 RepID=UPI0007AF1EFE|nr:uncharacterized protein LOC107620842 [Arachis ipaensis]